MTQSSLLAVLPLAKAAIVIMVVVLLVAAVIEDRWDKAAFWMAWGCFMKVSEGR